MSMAIQDRLNCGPLLETRQWLDQALRCFVYHWGMEASHGSNKVCHLDRKASHWHKMFPRPSSLDPVFTHVAKSFSTSIERTTLKSSFQQTNHRNFACQSHPCGDPQLKKQSGKRRQERKGEKSLIGRYREEIRSMPATRIVGRRVTIIVSLSIVIM